MSERAVVYPNGDRWGWAHWAAGDDAVPTLSHTTWATAEEASASLVEHFPAGAGAVEVLDEAPDLG